MAGVLAGGFLLVIGALDCSCFASTFGCGWLDVLEVEVFKAGLGADAVLAGFVWLAVAVDDEIAGLGPVRLCKGG